MPRHPRRNLRRQLTLAALVALPAALAGCHMEEGSGHPGEELRHIGDFDRVEVIGEFDEVSIEICDACLPTARVRGDDNLVDEVITSTRGSTLEIDTHGWLWPTLPLEVEIKGPPTVRVDISGSAQVSVDGVALERYDAVVSGSGEVTIRGATEHFEADVSGSGAVRAYELVSRAADVSVSGSGRVEVCAFGRLDASVSGSGDVRFDCAPRDVKRNVSGSGTIRGR